MRLPRKPQLQIVISAEALDAVHETARLQGVQTATFVRTVLFDHIHKLRPEVRLTPITVGAPRSANPSKAALRERKVRERKVREARAAS